MKFFVIMITLGLDALGFGIAIPVLPDLVIAVAGNRSAGTLLLGALVGGYSFMQFVFAPVLGAASDAWGRRPVLLLALAGAVVSNVLLMTATSFVSLLAGRLLAGATAASASVATAYIADITPPEKRSARFGLMSGVIGFGLVAGPACGGLLGMLGPRAPFILAGVLALINLICAALALPESSVVGSRVRFTLARANPLGSLLLVWRDDVFRTLVVAACFGMTAYGIFLACFVLTNEMRYGWGPRENGWAFAALGLGIALTQTFVLQRVVRRLGEYYTAVLGYGLFVLAYAVYGGARAAYVIAPAILLHSLALISDPTVRAMISVRAGPSRQGEYQGALVSLMELAATVAPILGAGMLRLTQSTAQSPTLAYVPFWVAALLNLCALVVLLRGVASPDVARMATIDHAPELLS